MAYGSLVVSFWYIIWNDEYQTGYCKHLPQLVYKRIIIKKYHCNKDE